MLNLKLQIMKNLKLLFIGALLCAFALNGSAQSVSEHLNTTWNIRVECDGVVDFIYGPVDLHRIRHFNPETNALDWAKFMFQSDGLVSWKTGETFSVNFKRKIDVGETEDVFITRFNLRGDAGTHILVTKYWILDKTTGVWTETEETKCM